MSITSIDKRSNISQKEFINEYVNKSIPVVITDLAAKWPGMGKLTPEFFKTNYGNVENEVDGKKIKMADYVDMMFASTEANPAPYPYSFNVERDFPELMKDLKPNMYYGKSDRINHPLLPKSFLKGTQVHEFFFGGKGSFFPFLHFDVLYLHTQITQLYGQKEFFLYPPEQAPYMYPREDKPKISSVRNIFNPDYEKFPLFKNAKPVSVMVNEGETVFFPTKWWHITKMHSANISYGTVHLNANNWPLFVSDNYKYWKQYHPAMSKIAKVYADVVGKVMDMQESFV
ncbi:MAG: cupin-like domain-containing protein [Bacteroidia bacterium]